MGRKLKRLCESIFNKTYLLIAIEVFLFFLAATLGGVLSSTMKFYSEIILIIWIVAICLAILVTLLFKEWYMKPEKQDKRITSAKLDSIISVEIPQKLGDILREIERIQKHIRIK